MSQSDSKLVYGGSLPPVPDNLTISQFLLHAQHPSRPTWAWDKIHPWLIEEVTGRHIGSDELRARMHGLANSLKARWNIGEDDVVCIFSPNHVDYAVVMWAVQALGGIVSTANPSYTAEELAYQLQVSRARLVVAGSDPAMLSTVSSAARASGLSPESIVSFDPVGSQSPHANVQELVRSGLREPQRYVERRLAEGEARTKLAFLSFSSGTTGKPKAVMIPHFSIIVNIVQMAHHARIADDSLPIEKKRFRPGSVELGGEYLLPFFHALGMHYVLHASLFFGSTVVVSPRFQLERMLQSIQDYRVTHLTLAPPHLVVLCKSPIVKKYDLSSVYLLQTGGAPASMEVMEQIRTRVLPRDCLVVQGYGMTEASTAVTMFPASRAISTPGSAGDLLAGIVARVVKPDGSLAGLNESGELHVKTPSASLGYLNNPVATAETFQDGWLRTGDEVRINELKEVFVVDRIKELIKVRGFQVAPSELEGHLLDHADVADACVVGIPDEYSGELPFAFVVASEGARGRIKAGGAADVKDGIVKFVAEHKVQYKHLAGVEFVDAVPKNASGKLLRRMLRDRAKEMLQKGTLVVRVKCKL